MQYDLMISSDCFSRKQSEQTAFYLYKSELDLRYNSGSSNLAKILNRNLDIDSSIQTSSIYDLNTVLRIVSITNLNGKNIQCHIHTTNEESCSCIYYKYEHKPRDITSSVLKLESFKRSQEDSMNSIHTAINIIYGIIINTVFVRKQDLRVQLTVTDYTQPSILFERTERDQYNIQALYDLYNMKLIVLDRILKNRGINDLINIMEISNLNFAPFLFDRKESEKYRVDNRYYVRFMRRLRQSIAYIVRIDNDFDRHVRKGLRHNGSNLFCLRLPWEIIEHIRSFLISKNKIDKIIRSSIVDLFDMQKRFKSIVCFIGADIYIYYTNHCLSSILEMIKKPEYQDNNHINNKESELDIAIQVRETMSYLVDCVDSCH